MIKFDEIELLALFDTDKTDPTSSDYFGSHDYQFVRTDGTVVSLGFNEHASDGFVSLSTKMGEVTMTWLSIYNCEIIRVLDMQRRQFEMIFDYTPRLRCFVDLNGPIIMTLSHSDY